MKKLLLILLCFPMIGFGQGWERTFDFANEYDDGHAVQETSDRGYIIAGSCAIWITGPSGYGGGPESDGWLIKTDSIGDLQWNHSFGVNNSGSDWFSDVQQTTDGGYIIIGTKDLGYPDRDLWLIKTDGNGNQLWERTFGGVNTGQGSFDFGESVQQTIDGGYIITGRLDDVVVLIKTNGSGIEQWRQTYGSSSSSTRRGEVVQQTTDGGYIILEDIANGNSGLFNDIGLIKTDASGNQIWTHTYGTDSVELAGEVQQTTDGGYIICGSTEFGGNGRQGWLVKTDNQGDTLWTKTYGGLDYDKLEAVEQTTDGGYILTGGTNIPIFPPFFYGEHVWLIKTDASGNQQWECVFGDSATTSYGHSVQQTINGGYIITGSTNGNSDVFLIKTDGCGNTSSTFNNYTPNTLKREPLRIIDVLGRETREKKNQPLFYIYDDGTVEKKIIIE